MERRDFLKLSVLTGAVTALDSCGSPDTQLIRFLPEEELTPGIATWKPSVCTLCSSGCGVMVRVMEGEAEVVRKGKSGVIRMGLAKKLEGNPDHPINRGALCARGQAGVQITYHPDRLRGPMKKVGSRSSSQFEPISWEEALKEVTEKLSALRPSGGAGLAFLSRPLRGHLRELVERLMKAFGAPAPLAYEPLDESVLRRANLMSFGHASMPTVNLSHADYVISFGADFLGVWNSPVSQSVGYGEMRQGRPDRRGRFVQVESRMSQTGANADEWVPCTPGREGALALGIAHVILKEKWNRGPAQSRAASLIPGWSAGLPNYAPDAVAKQTGVPAETITRIAREVSQTGQGGAIVGGVALAHTNGLFTALAVNALESLIDAGGNEGSVVSFMPQSSDTNGDVEGSYARLNEFAQNALGDKPNSAKVLLLGDTNPVFGAPPSVKVREAIAKIPYVVSFSSFIDETSAMSDLILPDHAPLESWLDVEPESGARQMVVSLAAPALHPLHDTRSMPDVLLGIAKSVGGPVAAALPWDSYDAMLKAHYGAMRKDFPAAQAGQSEDEFWSKGQAQGGWWGVPGAGERGAAAASNRPAPSGTDPSFDGSADAFNFYFQPYPSQSFRDGSLAHLPWLQEMPDVLTSAMWSSWVEINPKTAEGLKIEQGDTVEITSQHGSLRAPAVVSPGIAPDMVAMPIGQGHTNFTRFATGRGANPLSILAPLTEPETGSLAWAATRVKIARAGGPEDRKLILFSGGTTRFPLEPEPR